MLTAPADTVVNGSLLLAAPIAVLAGLISFLSPCVLPLVPGYISYATGLVGADLADSKRGRLLAGSLLFVLGFIAVFVAFGALAGSRRLPSTSTASPSPGSSGSHDPARAGVPRLAALGQP